MMMKKKNTLDLSNLDSNNYLIGARLSTKTVDSSNQTELNSKDNQSFRPLTSRNTRETPIKVQLNHYYKKTIQKSETLPYYKKSKTAFNADTASKKKIFNPYTRNKKKLITINRNYSSCDFSKISEDRRNNTIGSIYISTNTVKSMLDSPLKTVEDSEKDKKQGRNKLSKIYIFSKPKQQVFYKIKRFNLGKSFLCSTKNNIQKLENNNTDGNIRNNNNHNYKSYIINNNVRNKIIINNSSNNSKEKNNQKLSFNNIKNLTRLSKNPTKFPKIGDSYPSKKNADKIVNQQKFIAIIKNKTQSKINSINNYNLFFNNTLNNTININNSSIIDVKFEDLIIIDEKLNDIYIALNGDNPDCEREASNECIEFLEFYSHSSLKYKLHSFFDEPINKKIVQMTINFLLFSIALLYNLSKNTSMLQVVFKDLLEVLNLIKIDLYLVIRNIQIYYSRFDIVSLINKDVYLKTLDFILKQNNITEKNEQEISNRIKKNCINIAVNINKILIYYQKTGNEYYLDFIDICKQISDLIEKDIINYFYNHLCNAPGYFPVPKKKYFLQKINRSISNSANQGFNNKIKDLWLDYYSKKVAAPFIETKNEKKYTLVLGLSQSLVYITDDNKKISLRPGLFSFLNGIQNYYEIISFSNTSKEYADLIIKKIESYKQFFEYNFYIEHSILYNNTFIKDISRIGRDLSKIIIVDSEEINFSLNPENAILISPYHSDKSKNDNKLFYLKNLLLKFYHSGYEDLRIALKEYADEIKNNISSA